MTASSSNPNTMLADVVEEHADEAEFLLEQFERALASPTLTLADVADRLEPRLAAHIDALHIGARAAFERFLQPLLDEPDPALSARVCVASLVAIGHERFDALSTVLAHEATAVRLAAVRAFGLAGSGRSDKWLTDRWRGPLDPRTRASFLDVIAARRLETPPLIEWLQGEDLDLKRASARAAAAADARRHGPVVESLLDHGDEQVREAAMVAALGWGSQQAWMKFERWALDPDKVRPVAMALSAALGDSRHHARLAELVASKAHHRDALFALGFSGSVSHLAQLLTHVDGEDALASKLAAQAIATISGLDLRDPAFAATPPARPKGSDPPLADDSDAARALPRLEEDDLDADLVPRPEEELPRPNGPAIRRYCEQWMTSATKGVHHLAGRPLSPEAAATFLEGAPLGQRPIVALSLAIRTGRAVVIDTRAFSARQRQAILALRKVDPRVFARR